MRLIAAIRQRLEDVMREVRIRALGASVQAERQAGRIGLALEAYGQMVEEINARSPEQVARMERRAGLIR